MINKKLLVVCLTPFVLGMNLSFSAESTANSGEQISQVPENAQGNENPNVQQSANGSSDGQGEQNAQTEPDQGDLLGALFNTDVQTQDNTEPANPHGNIPQAPVVENTVTQQPETTLVTEQPTVVPQQAPVASQPVETVTPRVPVTENTTTPQSETTPVVNQQATTDTQSADGFTPEEDGAFMRNLFNEEPAQSNEATTSPDPVEGQAPISTEQPAVTPEQTPVAIQPTETVVSQPSVAGNTVAPQSETPVTEQPTVVPEQAPVVTQPVETVVSQSPVVENTVTPQSETTPVVNQQATTNIQGADGFTPEEDGAFMRNLFNEEPAQSNEAITSSNPVEGQTSISTEQPAVTPEQTPVAIQPTETVVSQPSVAGNTVAPQSETPVTEQPTVVPEQAPVVTQPVETVVSQSPVVENTAIQQSDIEKAAEHIKAEAEEMIDKKETSQATVDPELKNKVAEVDANIDETARKVDGINDQMTDFVLMMDARLRNIENAVRTPNPEQTEQPSKQSSEVEKTEGDTAIAAFIDKIDGQKETVSEPNAASTELTSSQEITKEESKATASGQQAVQGSEPTVNSEVKENSEEVLTKKETDEKVVLPETKPETASKDSLTEEKGIEIVQKNEDNSFDASKTLKESTASISPSESKALTPEAGKLETKPETESMELSQWLDPSLRAYIDKRVQESVNANFASLQKSKEENPSVVISTEGKIVESPVKNETKSADVMPKANSSEESKSIEEASTPADETGEVKKADFEVVKADEKSPESTILPENDNEKPLSISSAEEQKAEDVEPEKVASTESAEESSTQSNVTEKSVEKKNEGELKTSEDSSTEQIGTSDNEITKEESTTKSSNSEEPEDKLKAPSEESAADSQLKKSDELKSETNDAKDNSESNEKKSTEEEISAEHTEDVKATDDSDATTKSENVSKKDAEDKPTESAEKEIVKEESAAKSDDSATEESLKASETKDEGSVTDQKSTTEETIPESKIVDEKEPLAVQNEKLMSSNLETTEILKNTMNQLKNVREAVEALNSPAPAA